MEEPILEGKARSVSTMESIFGRLRHVEDVRMRLNIISNLLIKYGT
jgi:hypothetical protein